MDIETPPPAQLLQALAGREAMLRALFDNPLCAIIVTNVAGVIQSASAAALDRLGVELEAVIGQPLETFVKEVEPPNDAGVSKVELRRPDGSGTYATLSMTALPDGLHVGVLGPIEVAQDSLHGLRNSLARIDGFVEIIREDAPDASPRVQRWLHELVEATRAADEHAEALLPPRAPWVAPEALRGTETVLVVDKEQFILRGVRRMLMAAGYSVLTASEVPEALALYREHAEANHLVMVDVRMLEMSGPEVLDQLGQIHPLKRTAIMSDLTPPGVDPGPCVLDKPFWRRTLLEFVRERLDDTSQG